jgi:class 3 adenylate cyclase
MGFGTTTRTDSAMATSLPRRLAGILHADIVAFSRLTHDDEDTAYRIVQERMALVSTIINNHSGHVCDQTGDNLLALFHSAGSLNPASLGSPAQWTHTGSSA